MNKLTNVKKSKVNSYIGMNVEENIFDEETVNSLLKSEEDIEKGRTRNAAQFIKEFEEKYGI